MQAPLDIVHVNVYVPAPPAGVKTAAGAEVLLNWVVNALGPLTVHTPVPTVGVLAAKVAVLPKQTDWLEPAEEVVGAALTVNVIILEFAVVVQAALLVIIHCT